MAFGRGMNNKQVVEQHMSEQLREYNEALSASQSKIKTLKSCLNTIAEKYAMVNMEIINWVVKIKLWHFLIMNLEISLLITTISKETTLQIQ